MSSDADRESPQDTEKPSVNLLFRNDIRMQMWGLFSMYPELALSDLSEKLGKSKSTIHPHLKLLEEMDIIEVIRREKVRGSIKAKIYALKKGYDKKLAEWGKNERPFGDKTEIDKTIAEQIARQGRAMAKIKKNTLEMEIQFWDKILNSGIDGPDEYAVEIIKNMYELNPREKGPIYRSKDTIHGFGYFSKKSFKEFRNFFIDMIQNINEITQEEEAENPTVEKPYYFFAHAIPLKKMFEYLHPPQD